MVSNCHMRPGLQNVHPWLGIFNSMRQLHHFWLSPFSRKVRLVLAEKKLEFELKAEPVWERRDAFLSLNPAGEVPVLEEDGTVLCDSTVICEYLDEVYTDTPLLGSDARERAEIRRLVAWFDGKFNREVTDHLLGEKLLKRFFSTGTPDTKILRAGRTNAAYHLDYIGWLFERRNWLAGDHLTMADLARLTASADAKSPAGELRAGGTDLNVEIAGEFDGLDRIRAIALGEGPDGEFIRVGDVAVVEKGARTPADAIAMTQGRRAVFVAAYLQPELRVDTWSAAADSVVADFAASVPGVQVDTIFRQAEYVDRRLSGLARDLGYSALIVFAVLFLMMGWRAALIVGSALPLTVLAVLLLTRIYGEPLHQMSVTGLVVALGLLIDNAIVVVDEYRLMRARGSQPLEALDKAIRHLFAPLLASTLTTVFAFAPIALMPGASGEFISMIGISVIFAVVSSFLLAMTVVGAFAAWFDDPAIAGGPRRFWRHGIGAGPLASLYRGVLDAVTHRPWTGLVGGALLPIAGFLAASTLPMQFFPPTDRDMFQLSLELPSSTSIAETRRQTERATALIESYEGVERVSWVIGESAPRTYYNVVGNQSGVSSYAAGFVHTASPEATARILPDLRLESMTGAYAVPGDGDAIVIAAAVGDFISIDKILRWPRHQTFELVANNGIDHVLGRAWDLQIMVQHLVDTQP